MKILQNPALSVNETCTYLPDKSQQLQFFLATGLDESELDCLLKTGWRKFGVCYFRPRCKDCRECIPIRIPVDKFSPTKSQRRILRNGSDIKMKISPLNFSEDIFEIYKKHSAERFERETNIYDFYENFYVQSCPALQSEYYLNDSLIGAGFLDRSGEALSSVYFIFDPGFSKYSPGTLSILREIDYAASQGLKYYYLGYCIKNNKSMSYKGKFFPHELHDWETGEWIFEDRIERRAR